MKIEKRGKSFVVDLPADLMESLQMKEGDEVEVRPRFEAAGSLAGTPSMSREEALELLRTIRWPLPADYRFDRDEANAR